MLTQKHTVEKSQRMIFFKSRNLQHRNLLRDKLRAKMVIRATALFNLQRNNVALQVVRKCCPYYLTFTEYKRKSRKSTILFESFNKKRKTLWQITALSLRIFTINTVILFLVAILRLHSYQICIKQT